MLDGDKRGSSRKPQLMKPIVKSENNAKAELMSKEKPTMPVKGKPKKQTETRQTSADGNNAKAELMRKKQQTTADSNDVKAELMSKKKPTMPVEEKTTTAIK